LAAGGFGDDWAALPLPPVEVFPPADLPLSG
jgi:hypothetical protein